MSTYWVTGKRSPNNSVSDDTLNPFQRSRQPFEQPRPTSCPPSPIHKNFNLIPVTRTLQMFPPKPHEWPQAERRLSLSRNEQETGRRRSFTTGVIESVGNQHGSVTQVPTSQQAEAATNLWSSHVNSEMNLVRSMSEFNIFNMRHGFSGVLPTIPEGSTSNLRQQEVVRYILMSIRPIDKCV